MNKSTPPDIPIAPETASDGFWFVPVRRIPIDDHSWALRLGKPIQRATETQTAALTGVTRFVLSKLYRCGILHRTTPSPGKHLYYPAQVLAFLAHTQSHPHFWNDYRRHHYNLGIPLPPVLLHPMATPPP